MRTVSRNTTVVVLATLVKNNYVFDKHVYIQFALWYNSAFWLQIQQLRELPSTHHPLFPTVWSKVVCFKKLCIPFTRLQCDDHLKFMLFKLILATQVPMKLVSIAVFVSVTSASISIILTVTLLLTLYALVNARRKLGKQI